MSAPHWAPVDDDTADLLTLVADVDSPIGADVPALFLDACQRDAAAHGGEVSVNRVRMLLADADIPPRRYSALWSAFTGPGRPMRKAGWEKCAGSRSRNDGRPFPTREWVGT
jgi:hypothetical protein